MRNWITLKLMQYQLKKAKKQHSKEQHPIVKRAIDDMVKSYESAIGFIEANFKN